MTQKSRGTAVQSDLHREVWKKDSTLELDATMQTKVKTTLLSYEIVTRRLNKRSQIATGKNPSTSRGICPQCRSVHDKSHNDWLPR